MTAKRFTLEWYAQKYQELSEENEQLKQQLKDCEKFRYNVFNKLNEMMADE